jgi:tetratricopeptide (TPR) repeat protein
LETTRKARDPQAVQAVCICVFLALAVLAVFGQTAHFDFVDYDDRENVYANPVVAQGLSVKAVGWAFTHVQTFNWIPLTTLSHMLDCQLFGLHAGGHHLVNVLFHAASAVLLFLLLRQMTGSLWRSAFVAALFAVHPLRAESVAWVSERKDVLSAFFFLLAIGAYVRQARQPSRAGPVVVFLLFALGLLAKSMVATLPFVLLLLDYWPLGRMEERLKAEGRRLKEEGGEQRIPRSDNAPCAPEPPRASSPSPPQTCGGEGWGEEAPTRFMGRLAGLPFWELVKEKIPLFALAAASCVATALVPGLLTTDAHQPPLFDRLGNALVAYVVYLGQMVCPAGLATPYGRPLNGQPVWKVCLAFLLLAAISAGVVVWRKRRPYLLAGWLWYLGMLLPVIGVVQITTAAAHADRYTYLPGIGLALAATWAVADWSTGWKHRRLVLGGLMLAVIGSLAVCAHIQTSYWKDSASLWTRALACTSDNFVALNNQGTALVQQGKLEEAIAHFKKSLEIAPSNAEALNNLGNALAMQGADDAAIAQYEKALAIRPGYNSAHYNLGNMLLKHGRLDEAIAHFKKSLEIAPEHAESLNGLGYALVLKGDLNGAMACFEKAAALSLDPLARWCSLGDGFLQKGVWEAAIACYQQAIKINPRSADVCANLGMALYRKGQTKEAIDCLQQALEINPSQLYAQNNLALLLATAPEPSLRNAARAVALATQASQLSGGGNPVILHTLAVAYAADGNYSLAADTARRALALAAAQKKDALAATLQQEIKLYEAKTPPPNAPR